MEEEKKKEEQPEGEDNPQANVNILDRADNLLKRIEEREKELDRREKAIAERMLAGTAGANVKAEPHKMTDAEYRDSIMKGVIPKEDDRG